MSQSMRLFPGKTYGVLTYRSEGKGKQRRGWFELRAEAHVLLRLRRLWPKVKQAAGAILLRDSPEVCLELRWVLDRWPMVVAQEVKDSIEMSAHIEEKRLAEMNAVLDGNIQPRRIKTALPLRSYQAIAVELAVRSSGLLVGDELGVGKTAIGIGLLADPMHRPAAVVTVTHLPAQWKAELERFLPGIKVHIPRKGEPYDLLAKSARSRKEGNTALPFRLPQTQAEREAWPDVVVLPYSKLAGWADTLKTFVKTVVFDEAHELRRVESAKYESAKVLADGCGVTLGLTGTPVFNYGSEMWSILNVLRPDELGSREEFQREWCSDEDRVKDPASFGTYLRSAGLYIRRTRADVGRELPELTVVPMPIEVDQAPLREVKGVAAELARRIVARSEKPATLFQVYGELDWRLRQATGLAKAPVVAAFVQMLVEQGEQVFLGGWHRGVYDVWSEIFATAGIREVRYTGEETELQKQAAVTAFRDGEAQVLTMSLRSGAGLDGLQFGRCRAVVFGELDWSPQVHRQFIGRLHRDGQEKQVTAYYPYSNTGSDPVILDVLGVKRQQALGIEDPEGLDVAPVNDAQRVHRLAAEYLASLGESVESVSEPLQPA